LGGNALKAAGKTYGQALQAGAEGKQESGTKIVERFRDNFKAGLYKPW
jgi:hypothetical protein